MTDDGTPAPALADTEVLNIECTNTSTPVITSTALATASENTAYIYNITCSDADGDPLSLAKGAGDTRATPTRWWRGASRRCRRPPG